MPLMNKLEWASLLRPITDMPPPREPLDWEDDSVAHSYTVFNKVGEHLSSHDIQACFNFDTVDQSQTLVDIINEIVGTYYVGKRIAQREWSSETRELTKALCDRIG